MSENADGAGSGGRVRDGLLAAIPLAIAAGSLVTGVAAVVPAALATGSVLAVLLEWFAARHRVAARRVWERRSVQVGASASAVLLLAFVAFGRPESTVAGWLVSAAVGGLAAYLVLLGAVAARDAVG